MTTPSTPTRESSPLSPLLPSPPPRRVPSSRSLSPPTVSIEASASSSSTPATSVDNPKPPSPSNTAPEILTLDNSDGEDAQMTEVKPDQDNGETKGTKRKGKGTSTAPLLTRQGLLAFSSGADEGQLVTRALSDASFRVQSVERCSSSLILDSNASRSFRSPPQTRTLPPRRARKPSSHPPPRLPPTPKRVEVAARKPRRRPRRLRLRPRTRRRRTTRSTISSFRSTSRRTSLTSSRRVRRSRRRSATSRVRLSPTFPAFYLQ